MLIPIEFFPGNNYVVTFRDDSNEKVQKHDQPNYDVESPQYPNHNLHQVAREISPNYFPIYFVGLELDPFSVFWWIYISKRVSEGLYKVIG
jgi:hypothetical protein